MNLNRFAALAALVLLCVIVMVNLNRFATLAALLLLGVIVMVFSGTSAFTRGSQPTTAASVPSQDCSQDQADNAEEKRTARDTGTVDPQGGDQSRTDAT